MKKNKLLIRSAIDKDAYQIANVLLDFYNMENGEEATKVFINEQEKEFYYIVAIENNEILGLVTWLVHGLPKHGPIALIDENMPVVFIAPQDESFPKILANIEEVKAREGIIIAITDKINNSLKLLSDHTLVIPETHKHVFPITCSVVLQMLAYELAVCRDCEMDQPRNLTKSVTVE